MLAASATECYIGIGVPSRVSIRGVTRMTMRVSYVHVPPTTVRHYGGVEARYRSGRGHVAAEANMNVSRRCGEGASLVYKDMARGIFSDVHL